MATETAEVMYVDRFGRASSDVTDLDICPYVGNCWVAFEDFGLMQELRCSNETYSECHAFLDDFERINRDTSN